MAHLDALGQRADLRAHARQHRRPGSTRPRPTPRRRSSSRRSTSAPASRPTCCRFMQQIQIACDAAKFCVARLAGSRRRRSSRTTRRRSPSCAQRVRKTIDYVQSVPAGADRRQRRRARSRCRAAPGRSLMKGEIVPQALRAAELLLPRHDRCTRCCATTASNLGKSDFLAGLDHGRLRLAGAGAAAPCRDRSAAIAAREVQVETRRARPAARPGRGGRPPG